MKIIGVTGGIGSGKSSVCRIFERCGAKIIDADAISRRIMDIGSPTYNEVVEFFGAEILKENNEIDRRKLADIVFNDKEKLEALNMITHKYIFEKMRGEIAEYKDEKVVILDVPLLFDEDFSIEYDVSVAIVADEEIRIKRATMRDNSGVEKIRDRIRNQISDKEYYGLADYVIENNGDKEELSEKVSEVYNKIISE